MKASNIIDLVTHRLAKHLTLIFTGNIFAAGLGFLAVSVMLIASRLSDLGMHTAMIKFASSYFG